MLWLLFWLVSCLASLLGWITLAWALANVICGPDVVKKTRGRVFAAFMDNCKDDLKVMLKNIKDDVFKDIKMVASADDQLKKSGAINILEVGVGTGTNLEYYPAGSRLISVDPNPSFESYFRAECAKYAAHLDQDIRFVCERGERMSSVEDGSVDAVVATLVLCSVDEISAVMAEVKRVLVPGGKLYLVDHVGAATGSWRRRLQNACTHSGLWPALFDGCQLNRNIQQLVESAGFTTTELKSLVVPNQKKSMAAFNLLVNPIIYGTATK